MAQEEDAPTPRIAGDREFSPGDLYEDVYFHPCLCIGSSVNDDEIFGISLIDGSYPRSMSLAHDDIRKISLEEACELKHRQQNHFDLKPSE